jgi:S-adenosylmethionine-dependent methyltransferase
MLARWGRGVSYHEFELALGPLDDLVVGDGFDPEPMSYYGVSLETRLLYTYAVRKGLKVPPGFLRETLDVILRKPGGAPLPRRKRDLDAIVRPMLDP